jgi:ATP-binding cassette, subfamily B, bacterial PglK
VKLVFSGSVLGRCLKVIDPSDRVRVLVFAILQILANLLDLIGVALVGILGALAVSGVGTQNPDSRVLTVLAYLGLSNQSIQFQVSIVGTTIAIVLVLRTMFSILLLRRSLFFLGRCGSRISGNLASKIFNQPLTFVRSRSSQETVFALTRGIDAITVGVLGTSIAILSDISLLLILTIALLLVDYVVALTSFVVFTGFAALLYYALHVRAEKLGRENTNLGIKASSKIIEAIGTYRENLVHGTRGFYVSEIQNLRSRIAHSYSELAFLPSISKYSIEVMMVIGTLSLAAAQFYSANATDAVAKLAIFIAATSRIAPAALRIQQGALQLKTSIGSAEISLGMIDEMKKEKLTTLNLAPLNFDHPGFSAKISVKNLHFSYEAGNEHALHDISFSIDPGEVLAIVGPSGCGKTTLTDLILGVIEPSSGDILISNLHPLKCIEQWPGAISYVPQETFIVEGTIEENIKLGYLPIQITKEKVDLAIQKSQLGMFVETLPSGLDTQLGEDGIRLSGGQKQRLGIARGLVTNPKILVLDEATSALDAETENEMSKAIQEMKGLVTVIIVAHRLSTVKKADQIIYLDNGAIRAIGSFEEIRNAVPDFDNQAKLLGL